MKILKVLFTFCVCSTALLGDYVVFKSRFSNSLPFRAFSDSAVHAAIGFFSSLLFFSRDYSLSSNVCIYNVILCTIVSSVIDIDHFFVAKSIYLKDLSGLKQRGLLHSTTFWLLITLILLAYTYIFKHVTGYMATWMLIIAFTSHHLRDGNRRGLWCYPYGHTPPLPTNVYLMLIGTLPHVFAIVCSYIKPENLKPGIDYMFVV